MFNSIMKKEIHKPFQLLCLAFLIAISISAQEKEKPRVFISESKSWEIAGAGDGNIQGGASPQTAEIIKTFGDKCPGVIVTMKREKADYVVLLEHEGGKDDFLKDNKFAVFKEDGDSIKSGSTRTLGNAVKNACKALLKDWHTSSAKLAEEKNK